MHVFTQQLLHRQAVTASQFLMWVRLIWFLSFLSLWMVAPELIIPSYLFIAGGRKDGFMPSLVALALNEMQTASSRIWTHAVSCSYDEIYLYL